MSTSELKAFVADSNLNALVEVTLSSGNRRIVSDPITGTGVSYSFPLGVDLAPGVVSVGVRILSIQVDDGGAVLNLSNTATSTITVSLPPLLASEPAVENSTAATLTDGQLAGIVNQAITNWSAAGLTDEEIATLNATTFQIADLSNNILGVASSTDVTLDINAAGHGWFIDATPGSDAGFNAQGEASDRYDLLTAVTHELGHVLGYDHDDDAGVSVMDEVLQQGVRVEPTVEDRPSASGNMDDAFSDNKTMSLLLIH